MERSSREAAKPHVGDSLAADFLMTYDAFSSTLIPEVCMYDFSVGGIHI